jgi:hypothetical protein
MIFLIWLIVIYLCLGLLFSICFMAAGNKGCPDHMYILKRSRRYLLTALFVTIVWPWVVYNLHSLYIHRND